MNLLSYYIMRTVLGTTLLVLLALVGLEIFILCIGQLNELGRGDYGLLQMLSYVFLGLPQQVYQLFPMAGLVGILLGLGLLANHSELIVMQAAGVSLRQIAVIVMQMAIALVFAMTLMGETLAPYSKRMADSRKTLALSQGQALKTVRGIWVRDGQHFIHIRNIVSAEHLVGISRYTFDEQHRLTVTSYADHAYYQAPNWIFYDVKESYIQPKKVSSKRIEKIVWELTLSPTILKMAALEPRDMSLTQLYQTLSYQRQNGLHTGLYELALWRRVWQPFSALVMMWLAIPFIFGPLRSVSIGLRLVTGIGVGFSFYILNELLGSMSLVFRMPPVLMTVLPTLLCAFLGWLLLRKAT